MLTEQDRKQVLLDNLRKYDFEANSHFLLDELDAAIVLNALCQTFKKEKTDGNKQGKAV